MEDPSDIPCLSQSQQHVLETFSKPAHLHRTLPQNAQIQKAVGSLVSQIPSTGYGIEKTTAHLLGDVVPALNGQALSPNDYGFVTGSVTPAARIAENLVSTYDQNVQVHLPDTTIATELEDRALELLLELLHFTVEAWPSRTFTTGATASNIIGLACAREFIVNNAIRRRSKQSTSPRKETVGEDGLLAACRAADITDIQVLTTMPHSSLKKASSVVGLGRACFHRVSIAENDIAFDLDVLEDRLKRPHTVSIVVISCAEVNTGMFATRSYLEVGRLRSLCDKYGSWLHVDAAFGLFARILDDSQEFRHISDGAKGMELADSIAGDAHKLLNVPYDCGFFFSRHAGLAQQVFQNPKAAYLSSDISSAGMIQSPLNIGLENSRRFRALPVYATLVSYGRTGYEDMLQRQIRFARRVAWYIHQHRDFDLLPRSLRDEASIYQRIYIIVLFRAKEDTLNNTLIKRLNASCQMYVSGTSWENQQACRIAAANWQVDPERDSALVQEVFERALTDWRHESS
ncbi:MAG: hypothetical protein L6R42_001043 [Xanthoria sp. 1 TBL-2021]|nr:MAG: hypothetical protein L6R42_001043 [Xanthoria sp. 1 TBL-2021]